MVQRSRDWRLQYALSLYSLGAVLNVYALFINDTITEAVHHRDEMICVTAFSNLTGHAAACALGSPSRSDMRLTRSQCRRKARKRYRAWVENALDRRKDCAGETDSTICGLKLRVAIIEAQGEKSNLKVQNICANKGKLWSVHIPYEEEHTRGNGENAGENSNRRSIETNDSTTTVRT
jgi:hypothetical protein